MNKPSIRERIDAALADWHAKFGEAQSCAPDVIYLGLRDSMQLDAEMKSLVTRYRGLEVLFNGTPSCSIVLGRRYG